MPAKPHTWILLRGLAREKMHWGDFTQKFASRFPADEVLALDLPGTGEFHASVGPRSVSDMFNFVRAQAIQKARTQSPFKLVALSLGGMVAMEWMRQKADDLSGVVLINTSSKKLSPFYYRLRWQIWRNLLQLMTVQSAREREQGILALLMNKEDAQQAALPLWTKIATERPISYISFFNQLYAAARFSGLTSDPGVPTLLLSSLGDKLVDPSCSTRLHEQWGWPVLRHPWAGHDLPWDDPQWMLEKIAMWNSSLTRE